MRNLIYVMVMVCSLFLSICNSPINYISRQNEKLWQNENTVGNQQYLSTLNHEAWNITNAVEYIASCQYVDGGFGPPGQISYLNYTSIAIFVLGWLGELDKISIEDALNFILGCYVGYGFGNVLYPEDADIISTWYGVRALKYLGRLDLIDVEAIKNYALSIPWETTVTMALAIDILFNLNFLDVVDVDSIIYYLTSNPP